MHMSMCVTSVCHTYQERGMSFILQYEYQYLVLLYSEGTRHSRVQSTLGVLVLYTRSTTIRWAAIRDSFCCQSVNVLRVQVHVVVLRKIDHVVQHSLTEIGT